jgi:hypothetical protein
VGIAVPVRDNGWTKRTGLIELVVNTDTTVGYKFLLSLTPLIKDDDLKVITDYFKLDIFLIIRITN